MRIVIWRVQPGFTGPLIIIHPPEHFEFEAPQVRVTHTCTAGHTKKKNFPSLAIGWKQCDAIGVDMTMKDLNALHKSIHKTIESIKRWKRINREKKEAKQSP